MNNLLSAWVHSVPQIWFKWWGQFLLLYRLTSLRSQMYSRKSIGPRMDPWETPALTEYSCKDFPSRTKLDWDSYIISIANTASKEIGASTLSALTFLLTLLSAKFALYLYKSTTESCMEYCCHVWPGAPSCYFKLLDNLQTWICRTVGTLLAASLEPLAHHRNIASISLFYRYYFGRYSSELVVLPYSWGRPTCYSDRLHYWKFLSTFLDVTRMSMSTVSFLAQLDSEILDLLHAFFWLMI